MYQPRRKCPCLALMLIALLGLAGAATCCPWPGYGPTTPTQCFLAGRGENQIARCQTTLLYSAAGSEHSPLGVSLTYWFSYRSAAPGGGWSGWSKEWYNLDNQYTSVQCGREGTQYQMRSRVQCGLNYWSNYRESNVLTVQNTLPTPPASISLTPASPQTTDDLTAQCAGATDVDGQALTYDCHWYYKQTNGVFAEAYHGNPLPASYTSGNQEWFVTAFAYDGLELSNKSFDSAVVTIANAPPLPPKLLTISPEAPRSIDPITATASGGKDPDNGTVITDPISYQYQWSQKITKLSWSPWADLDGQTLSASRTTRGNLWQARARTVDSHGAASTWFYSAAFSIGNSPPTRPTAVSASPAHPLDGQNLSSTASGATDPDGDTISYRYAWFKSSNGTTWVAGPGTQTVPASLTLPGQYWKVRARGFDGVVYGPWKFSAVIRVAVTPSPAVLTNATAAASPAGGLQITVNLSSAATVGAVITNLAGVTVAALPERPVAAGATTLLWNGKSMAGTKVPPGRYVVKVQAHGGDGGGTSALLALQLR